MTPVAEARLRCLMALMGYSSADIAAEVQRRREAFDTHIAEWGERNKREAVEALNFRRREAGV